MPAFGLDFRRAKSAWLYNAPTTQAPWLVFATIAALLVLHLMFQSAAAVATYALVFGGDWTAIFTDPLVTDTADFMKAGLIGLAPGALLTCLAACVFANVGRRSPGDSLALQFPKLGFAGWALIIVVFALSMYATFIGTFFVLDIDPSTYSPAKGLQEGTSKSGMVERTMAELRNDPLLFALALPGVTLLVPMAEELIFRGALFSALVNSPVGRWGAVLITAAAWALIHFAAAPALYVGVIFIMGIFLGLLLLRFGSLWVTIVCHMVWNTLTSLAIFGLQS